MAPLDLKEYKGNTNQIKYINNRRGKQENGEDEEQIMKKKYKKQATSDQNKEITSLTRKEIKLMEKMK